MPDRVLVAPLPWGLGHATRCIPLIHQELNAGNKVLVAADAAQQAVLADRFSDVEFIELPFVRITYPVDGNMVRHFFWNGPKLLRSIWREHWLLKRAVRRHAITKVISDSRFGLWTSRAHCIFVTHQLHIFAPRFERLINALHRWVMNRYNEVWIPDEAAYPGLAGELSHPEKLPANARYIGPLSRFSNMNLPAPSAVKHLGIVSGPEPLRSHFERTLAARFIELDEPALIVRGLPDAPGEQQISKLKLISHLDDRTFAAAVLGAEHIYTRSGYSTIMDLYALGKTASFTPTPGQTEQEYLAELHANQSK